MANIEKIHEDKRGEIYRILFNNKEFILYTLKSGFARGGDYHKSKQFDVILSGSLLCLMVKDGQEKNFRLTSGDKIAFDAGVPHLFKALEDSLVIEWLEGGFEKSYYPPYRRLVEQCLKSS